MQLSARLNRLAPSATLAMSQKSAELKAQGVDIINLSVGEPDFNTPDHIKAAAKQAIDDNWSRYSPVPGYLDLREAICGKLLRENHLEYTPAQIVVGNGAKQAVCNVLLSVVGEGDEVIIPAPYWVSYPDMVRLADGTPVFVEAKIEQNFKITPAQLEAAITPRTRVVMACTPNNPTGTILTAEELAELVAGVPRDVVVLIDEAYLDFVTDPQAGDALTLLAGAPNLVVSRTFSKAHALAGMRVGYLVCEPGLAAAIRSVSTPFGVNLPAQAAAAAALGETELARTAERSATVAAERDRVVDALRTQGWQVPEAQGNFFWLGVGDETAALAEHFRAAGILVRPFAGEGVRVSVGTTSDNERVLAAAAAWGAEH